MSVQFLYDGIGKWFKDLPVLSTLVDDKSFVNKYWDVAQNSWRKASSNDVLLHLSILLYHLMQEQQRHLSHYGVDFSHASEKLLNFIQECLLAGREARCLLKLDEYESVGEMFTAFMNAVRNLSTVCVRSEGAGNIYIACSNAWTFVKNLAQTKGKVVTCDAGTKIQNVCKMANDLFSSQIDKLTLNFMDNAERIILSMFDVCNNSEFLQATWSTSPKISYLLAYILEFADQFLDYISSLTALDIEIEFELGWAEIEDDEVVVMETVAPRRRQMGQH